MTVFDTTPHPDERIEWLRAQTEEYLKECEQFYKDHEISLPFGIPERDILVKFVHDLEEKFKSKGLFD